MNWYNDKKEYWKELIKSTAETTGRSKFMIEKDIIQSLFLYNLSKSNSNIVFKGGTSLSKVYNIIDRFSEDLDLSMIKKPTESEKRTISKTIKEIGDNLGLILDNIDDIKDRYSYNKYMFSYLSLFDNSKSELLVETSFYQVVYPVENKNVNSFVNSFIENNNNKEIIELKQNLLFEMPVQCLVRTFIDKVFATCDYYIENVQERDSRHLYDICKLYDNINFDNSFNDLFYKVRRDRMGSKNNPSANPKYKIHDMLKEIIKTKFYENDYNKITKRLLYEDVDYDKAIKNGIERLVKSNLIKDIEDNQQFETLDIKKFANEDAGKTITKDYEKNLKNAKINK